MPFNIIQQLKGALPESRPTILQEMYQKNLNFFSAKYPALHRFIDSAHCPYHLEINERFLNIIDDRTGKIAHPKAGLDHFAQMLGNWTHEAWVDLFNFQIPLLHKYPKHYKIVQNFSSRIHQVFPELEQRLSGGRINLKTSDAGRKFSPPVVFLGIFHGLHIAHYLHNTDLTTALFIEPEPERFEVSCYFLDYTEIEQRIGTLYLAIGSDMTAGPIESFFSLVRITPMLWTRVLCGYSFKKANLFIESLKSLQATNTNLLYPLDNEIDGLMHGVISLNKGLPILTTRPQLSRQCRIAVVATGPSLENDLEWLKNNQNNLIIFAVHSAIEVLRAHGIKPDFQFNIDAIILHNFVTALGLFPDIPFITDYKAPPHILADFKKPLLCASAYNNSVVQFHTSLTETHPSTTNLAFSFACWLKPAAIYLLGCDCGYRSLDLDHAKGTAYFQQEKSRSYAANALQCLVEPNFAETDPIQTISQHLRTKITIERCIEANGLEIMISNLSDGSLIRGTNSQHSANVQLSKYSKKQQDIKKILLSFRPAQKNLNWKHYSETGANRLLKLRNDLLKALSLDTFSWQGACQAFDSALSTALLSKSKGEEDHRMDMYSRVLGDLLSIWYRSIILLDHIEEAARVYDNGFILFKESLEDLEWPTSFDAVSDGTLEQILPARWKIYLAELLGRQGDLARAESLIARAYHEDEQIRDCYARLGWIHAEKRNWRAAFDLAVKDVRLQRLSPLWQINVAQLYGRCNDAHHGCELIESAYHADSGIKDGFAQLGWIFMETRNWGQAHSLMRNDLKLSRLTPFWKIHFAIVNGCLNQWPEALSLAAEVYNESASFCDGYTWLGWWGYLLGKDTTFFREMIDMDGQQRSPSTAVKIYHALYHTAMHSHDTAHDIVNQVYQQNPKSRNWYTTIGWLNIKLGKINQGLALMKLDHNLGSMDDIWLVSYGVALGLCDKKHEAFKVLDAVVRDSSEESRYNIGYLSFPDATATRAQLKTLLTDGIAAEKLKKTLGLSFL